MKLTYETYKHICTTFLWSRSLNLGTCRPRGASSMQSFGQRMVQLGYSGKCLLHPIAPLCFEGRGSQADLHLAEKTVIAWRQVRALRETMFFSGTN